METAINKTQKKDILLVDPRLLRIEEGFNTRVDFGDIDELSSSIVENGVINPLRGYKEGDFYIIINGERRYRAIMLALNNGHEIARVPFISVHKKTMEERIFEIVTTNDGKPLTALELGETYKKLMNFGHTYSDIAKKVGKTVKHISDMVLVAESGKEIKTLITDGQVSATLVAEVKSKVKDVDAAENIIKKATALKNGQKVTKKDIAEIQTNKVMFSEDDVIRLLTEQVKACANMLDVGEHRNLILNTKLVFSTEKV